MTVHAIMALVTVHKMARKQLRSMLKRNSKAMAKDQNQRNRDRIERNKNAGLMKVTTWIPECKRGEFLQLAAAWTAEHKSKAKKACPDE